MNMELLMVVGILVCLLALYWIERVRNTERLINLITVNNISVNFLQGEALRLRLKVRNLREANHHLRISVICRSEINKRDAEEIKRLRNQLVLRMKNAQMRRGESQKASVSVGIDPIYTKASKDIETLAYHSGAMFFVGANHDGEVGRVKINSLSGCVAVPALLIELSAKTRDSVEMSDVSHLEQRKHGLKVKDGGGK